MSALLTTPRPPSLFDAVVGTEAPADVSARPAAEVAPARGRRLDAPTLATVLDAAWTELRSGTATACPVCSATMDPVYGAGARAIAGRCGGCGSQLA